MQYVQYQHLLRNDEQHPQILATHSALLIWQILKFKIFIYLTHQIITKNIRKLLNIERPNSKRSIALPPRGAIATFLERKSRTGRICDALEFDLEKL